MPCFVSLWEKDWCSFVAAGTRGDLQGTRGNGEGGRRGNPGALGWQKLRRRKGFANCGQGRIHELGRVMAHGQKVEGTSAAVTWLLGGEVCVWRVRWVELVEREVVEL